MAVICWVLLHAYRALRRFSKGAGNPAAPIEFVARLVALGPAFVKLGQAMSTRPDMLPTAYVEALSALQEKGPRVPTATVRMTIERDLCKTLKELFAAFDQVPVAAASLAQVHRARLPDGTAVAVKVQRPDLKRLMGRDLDAMALGLRWLYRLAPRRMQRTNLLDFFAEFRRYTLRELDFLEEGRVIDRFRANLAGRAEVKFPGVHFSHSSQRLLTMDWVEGLRLREATSSLGEKQKQRLVTLLVDVLLQMFVSDGRFHADLHPGTYSFTPTAASPCLISAWLENSRRRNATGSSCTGSLSFSARRAAPYTTSKLGCADCQGPMERPSWRGLRCLQKFPINLATRRYSRKRPNLQPHCHAHANPHPRRGRKISIPRKTRCGRVPSRWHSAAAAGRGAS